MTPQQYEKLFYQLKKAENELFNSQNNLLDCMDNLTRSFAVEILPLYLPIAKRIYNETQNKFTPPPPIEERIKARLTYAYKRPIMHHDQRVQTIFNCALESINYFLVAQYIVDVMREEIGQ